MLHSNDNGRICSSAPDKLYAHAILFAPPHLAHPVGGCIRRKIQAELLRGLARFKYKRRAMLGYIFDATTHELWAKTGYPAGSY
jgi:hypothetical protein